MQNALTGNYLITSGERAIYQKYDGSANQKWRIIDGQNGTFGIQSNTSQYLTVTNKNELVLNATKSNSAWKLALFVSKTEN
ncbi:RICIN domain-containing protein [Enterococcus italicus]|uniref:RICIN domain-containing protein n=1 Tax=Enterococcus italicus TaxID=246144 RepID=UPI003993F57E